MWKPKPTKPEDLYKLFTYGMPLKPTRYGYYRTYLRKGWNVYTEIIKPKSNEITILQFYSLASAYYPDWKLEAYKYVDVKTK